MPAEHTQPQKLTHHLLIADPESGAQALEELGNDQAKLEFTRLPESLQAAVWQHCSPDLADALLQALEPQAWSSIAPKLEAGLLARSLGRLDARAADALLGHLDPQHNQELKRLMSYPPGTAGHLMHLRPATVASGTSVAEARKLLSRRQSNLPTRQIFLLKTDGSVNSVVDISDLALAASDQAVDSLGREPRAAAHLMDTADTIVALLEQSNAEEIPVLDSQERLAGVIRSQGLRASVKDKALSDMQTMVGASEDERALSPVLKAAKTRVIWMHINLLTAFLAAAVVGLFEDTIARFTALAVLLPVVAGQSGNAGAQALAVTMRGLALREVSIRQWWLLLSKETRLGLLNGVAVAVSTAVGVLIWSKSLGLAAIIASSMVLSMTIACMAGAMVPVVLTRLRQDPASSASIILTTVTDIAGFFSFLGIATLMSAWLVPG